MTTRRTSYHNWRQPLGEVMPVAFVHRVADIPKHDVARAVAREQLPVFTFRGDDGRVYRMVRLVDVQRLTTNPLTLKGMARALDRLMRQTPPPHADRPAPSQPLRRAA